MRAIFELGTLGLFMVGAVAFPFGVLFLVGWGAKRLWDWNELRRIRKNHIDGKVVSDWRVAGHLRNPDGSITPAHLR